MEIPVSKCSDLKNAILIQDNGKEKGISHVIIAFKKKSFPGV